MPAKPIAILGGGNTAFSVAAHLTLQGHRIILCELPEFAASLDPIRKEGAILLRGSAGEGKAAIHHLTTDMEEALSSSDLALLIVPAYAHRPFARACIPHLRSHHTVVLMPGTLGSLEWAHLLHQAGKQGIILAEVDTAPYVCRKTAPDTATIWGVVNGLGLGVLPLALLQVQDGSLQRLIAHVIGK